MAAPAAVVAVVDPLHPLRVLALALALALAQGKTATKEMADPCHLYVEVSDDLSCGIFLFNIAGRICEYRSCSEFKLLFTNRSHNGRSYHTHSQGTYYSLQTGHITVVPTARIPKRLAVTANCYNFGGDGNRFSFIVDILLVPLSFDMETCFKLYQNPFKQSSESWYMGTRCLRDNIILLRKFAVQGEYVAYAVEEMDIPEDIRSATNYRLVVTCPALLARTYTNFGVSLQLEMEF